jgi:hypothetical protein
MDQPICDPKTLFDAIVADAEMREMTTNAQSWSDMLGEFDNADHSDGLNNPTPAQCAAAAAILRKARELRRILRS